MVSFQPFLSKLLKSLPSPPVDQLKLEQAVKQAITASSKTRSSAESRKSQWEYLLKNEIFKLAMSEGQALKEDAAKYYDQLRGQLDLILTFTDNDGCEQTFPFLVLQDLLETQTIASCSHIFSWIEARSNRLTEGMVPQKGKALILLRTLNDLLRRLSKMGSTTIFCGRILTFLSGVYPLGERSGVNLRGEYGPMWEGVPQQQAKLKVEEESVKEEIQEDIKMEVEDKKIVTVEKQAEEKNDFYNTFWSLQSLFSRPPLFSDPSTFPLFKESVAKVIPVIKEATAKERAMMGSRTTAVKRKRDADSEEESVVTEYFFAKFLTSPDLLDLEIADTHFRRQFLFQLFILLHHLLLFTKPAKETWSTARNRSLQMEFTLESADEKWVHETLSKISDEMRQTTPNGRQFFETVTVILEREKNWIKWKNELCAPFDKEPWVEEVNGKKVGLIEATEARRATLRHPIKEWPHRLGSQALTEIWDLGYRTLADLENFPDAGDPKDFVKKIKAEDFRISQRKQNLAKIQAAKAPPRPATPPPTEAPPGEGDTTTDGVKPDVEMAPPQETTLPKIPAPNPTSAPPDELIMKLEENKQRWAWLALRSARDLYLQHFGKIGTGDIELLVQEIEKEARGPVEKVELDASNSPRAEVKSEDAVDGEGDVKMVSS